MTALGKRKTRLARKVVLAFCALAVIACNWGPGGAARAQTPSPWQQLTNLPPGGAGPTLLLTDGTVIGSDGGGNWYRLTPDINGSYVNGTWSQIASMPSGYRPDVFASAVLPDGRVIIEGGEYNGSSTPVWTNQGAIYDPIADAWTTVQPPSGSGWSNIGDAPSTVLSNGTFLLGSCCSSQNALLNADSLTWTATGAGKFAPNGEAGFTLLPDGSVLTVDVIYPGSCGTNSEIYSPATGRWTSAGSTIVRLTNCAEIGPQVLRPDGTVIVFGGTSIGGPAHTAIYNSNSGTWAAGPDIPAINGQYYTLTDYPAALLPSGNVLFAAGPQPGSVPPTHWFVFDGAAIAQVPDNPIAPYSSGGHLMVLPTGQILYSGEYVYNDSGAPNPAWAPVISSVSTTLVPGATYQVSGLQLNGLSQGAMFGDDWQMATNYPLVRITNNATGHVFYARTFGHSSMSVAPNTLSFTNFTVPRSGKIELGASQLVVANGIASQPAPVTVVSGPTSDFYGNGYSDILWQNTSGEVAIWEMKGTSVIGGASLGNPGPSWHTIATGDFNGDGHADILWQNASGEVAIWEMNETNVIGGGSLGNPGPSWHVIATGDFNGDGHADILWQNASGEVAIWEVNGTNVIGGGSLGNPGASWHVIATGDFNGDGHSDILWQNDSGEVAIWEMNGTSVIGGGSLGNPGPSWHVKRTGDFNGDGYSDILWQNDSGEVAIWEMKGTNVIAGASLGNPGPSWHVKGTGDFNHDGHSDILWRNVSGEVAIWEINGTSVIGGGSLGNPGSTWHPIDK